MQNNVYSVAANAQLEKRYQVRKAFEEGAPLQYRKINHNFLEEWKDATWSRWEWARYEYRIKPKEKEKVELEVINTEEKVDEPKSKKTTNKKKESNYVKKDIISKN